MKKILVVDDDKDITLLVQNRLEKNNYKVFTTNDGAKAGQMAYQTKPDLIIMDIMMPRVDGGEAVRQLKTDDTTKHIPVLFFTAMLSFAPAESTDLGQINVAGELYPALTKPFDPDKLLSAVKMLLDE